MDTLTGASLVYLFDNLVLVRVASENNYGKSDYAYNLDGAKVRSVPSKMNTPTISSYSDTAITVTWAALTGTNTGNSPIKSYSLYWNAGSGTSAGTLVTEALITTYTFSSITGGNTYYFKVIAKNVYGVGTESDPVDIKAIDVPGKMAIPDVSNSGTKVIVDFAEPNIHYSAILEYDI